MITNYRLLRKGQPVAWFTHADQVETILHNDPSPFWSVEFCAIPGKYLQMQLNDKGWLMFTPELQEQLSK